MDLKEWIKRLWFFPILTLLDVASTILFTNKYGIYAESNAIGRYWLGFGNVGFVFMFLFSTLGLFLIVIATYYATAYIYKKSKRTRKKFDTLDKYQNYNNGALLGALVANYSLVLSLNLRSLF